MKRIEFKKNELIELNLWNSLLLSFEKAKVGKIKIVVTTAGKALKAVYKNDCFLVCFKFSWGVKFPPCLGMSCWTSVYRPVGYLCVWSARNNGKLSTQHWSSEEANIESADLNSYVLWFPGLFPCPIVSFGKDSPTQTSSKWNSVVRHLS